MNLQEGGAKNRYWQSKYHKISGQWFPILTSNWGHQKKMTFVCVQGGGCIGKSVWGTLLKEAMMRSRI